MNETEYKLWPRPFARSASRDGSDPAMEEGRLAQALEEYRALLEAGRKPDRLQFLARYPEMVEALSECLAGLEFVHAAAANLSQEAVGHPPTALFSELLPSEHPLGDFRILREVGRGGMGVVYEAEQLSLRRRVALKVLPFAATMDPRHLQRFHNEAQAAACLHHTNIVPVYFVGCERGVHFYAMQFIDGQPLSEVIRQLRELEKKTPTATKAEPTIIYQSPSGDAASTPRPAADMTPLTGEGRRGRDYFRKVAELGVQAAEALDHAHQLGIVHRDIKPGNLLVDGAGRLWVTDFGLAHMQHGEANLTMTGQAVGTPRYMSPEQALAKRAPIDHRTDVYSLGATLYELLTLLPAFEGEDRQELLRQIAFEEPTAPRRLNPAVPVELETIVLKAMAKNLGERYTTAGELADDLRRWLEDRPIRARRPPMRTRLVRWGRRHRTWVVSVAAALIVGLAVLAGSFGWVVRDRAARQARVAADLQAALDDALRFEKDGNRPRAQAAARRAESLLRDSAHGPALAERVRALVRELDEEEADDTLLARLDAIRSLQAEPKDGHFNLAGGFPHYRDAFARYGWQPGQTAPEEAAARLLRRPAAVRGPVVAALDHWLILARYKKAPEAGWLKQVLSADPDPWRQAVRAARARNDRRALEKLAAEADATAQPPEELFLLDLSLFQRGAQESAVALLRRAQEAFPGDFWINHDLGLALLECRPPRYEEAIRYLTAAVALRPGSPGARVNLGVAFLRRGQLDEAVTAFRQTIALRPDYATAHNNLGLALARKKQPDEAFAAFREAIRLKPDFADAHANLGYRLLAAGRVDEAVDDYRRYTEANPANAVAHYNLGNALRSKGAPGEAAAAYRRAVARQPGYAEAHCNLGLVLRQQGEFTQALAALEQGHELGSRRKGWPYPSARWVRECQRLVELEGHLPALLGGEVRPANAAEQDEYAQVCYGKKHYAAAARLWVESFAADPKRADDSLTGHRGDAAYAAALAAAGRGVDAGQLGDPERKRWRKQALDWLRADLAACADRLESTTPGDRGLIVHQLRQWRCDHELAGLRDPAAVARLPADEQEACRLFWAEVGTLLDTADPAR